MKKFFKRFKPTPNEHEAGSQPGAKTDPVPEMGAQREMQLLRMELETQERRIAQLTQEAARLRERQDALVTETVAARMEGLVSELAGPASQIRTQVYLADVLNKSLQTQDVLAVTKRILRTLERHGMVFEGEIGSEVGFDPNTHAAINAATAPRAGDAVKVRFSGVRYEGRIVTKAMVE